ncbi:MAG: hypothetical protein ACFCD0_29980 [Gemmataceae bacterium]
MILLYLLILIFLGLLQFLFQRRANKFERKYARLVLEAQKLADEPIPRQGNSNRSDPYSTAKQQYELGRIVQRRDHLEARHFAWQSGSDKLSAMVKRLREWRGKVAPYVLGIADVMLVLVGFHLLDLVNIDMTVLLGLIESIIAH